MAYDADAPFHLHHFDKDRGDMGYGIWLMENIVALEIRNPFTSYRLFGLGGAGNTMIGSHDCRSLPSTVVGSALYVSFERLPIFLQTSVKDHHCHQSMPTGQSSGKLGDLHFTLPVANGLL